jgi:cation:H+ antiporter
MAGLIAQFVLIALVVVVAGTLLARFADELGMITGMGRSMAGVVLLALATSLPELLVGCKAAMIPAVDLTLGDLLGSSLFNLLILAVLDLCTKTHGAALSKSASAHALSAVSGILLTAVVLFFLMVKLPGTFLRLGPGSWFLLVTYLFCLRLIFFDQQYALSQAPKAAETPTMSRVKSVTGYLLSAAVIFVAAPKLASVASELADITGLGGTIVGTLFVALIPSLPEAVTTLTALRMGATDLAIGNIFGSNAFNMLIFVGVDLFYDGSLFAAASETHAVTAAMVIFVTAVAIQGLLYRAEKRLWIVEPDAALLVVLVVAALSVVFWMSH